MNAIVPIHAAPMAVSDVERVALAIAKGGLFGSKDPNAVLTLCLLAQAEGQHPAVVFRDYHIINGKPAKKADAMLRDFITAGGKVEWHALDDTKADATFSHPSGSARIDWTLERAKKAGLTTQMWTKYPRQMLRSRVISEGVRTVFPGATSGLYEVGEVQDITGHADEPEAPKSELREQLVQSVAQTPDPVVEAMGEPEPKRKRAEPMKGPYSSKTALWAAVRTFDREVRSCGDDEQLDALLAEDSSKALLQQCDDYFPFLTQGGEGAPPEFEPLYALINRMRADFASEVEEHTERYRNSAIAAG